MTFLLVYCIKLEKKEEAKTQFFFESTWKRKINFFLDLFASLIDFNENKKKKSLVSFS